MCSFQESIEMGPAEIAEFGLMYGRTLFRYRQDIQNGKRNWCLHTHRAIVKEDVAEGAVYGHDER